MKTKTSLSIALAACLSLVFPMGVFAAGEQVEQTREQAPGVDRWQGMETETETVEPTAADEAVQTEEQGEGEMAADESPSQRIERATATLRDMIDREGEKIPSEVIRDAEAVAIFPDLTKAGMIVGGRYGEGVLMVHQDGTWSGPLFLSIYGASVGAQLGIESTDMIMVFMEPESLQALRDGTLEFGAEASVAAGTAGAKAKASTQAEILGYQDTEGLFAGLSLSSGYIAVDETVNEEFFQEGASGETRAYYTDNILTGKETPKTRQGDQLAEVLNQYAQQTGQGQTRQMERKEQ